MSTITTEQQTAIASKLATMHLPSGLGDEHSACSIAAINLALSGKLTDEIPDCMSRVIGQWILVVQDAMPDDVRNSEEWKSLLPLAAGTGRVNERERLDIILDWMWGTVLPSLQSIADQQGFGRQWQKMTTDRTAESANAAAMASAWAAEEEAGATRGAAAEAEAARVARAAATAARVARAAAAAAARWATRGARAGAAAAAEAVEVRAVEAAGAGAAANWATRGAGAGAAAAAEAVEVRAVEAAGWANFDPCGLLERLIKIDNNARRQHDRP
jgi:hypothetical protein